MRKSSFTIVVLVLLCSSYLFASGFQLNEQGARAMAMAGAFTGIANDPSAVYYNPAGLTNLYGTHFMGGVTFIAPSFSFTGAGSGEKTDGESKVFTPFNVYITHRINEKWAVGLGVNNQYGLGTEWDETWEGRYLAVDTEIKTFYFSPAVAFKPSEKFSIGVGLTYVLADVKIVKMGQHPLGADDYKVTLKGDDDSFGFSAGIMVKPIDKLSLGLSYRSENSYDMEGDASSDPATFTYPGVGEFAFPNGPITAPLTTPQNITFGVGYMPDSKWTIGADFQYVGWESYDKLEITFEDYDTDPFTAGNQNVSSTPRNYENSFIVRAGAEYILSPKVALRGGLLYDNNPVKDEYVEPTLPDADRIGINLGFGYEPVKNFKIDVAYLFLMFNDREVDNSVFGFNGKYESHAHLFGLDFSYGI